MALRLINRKAVREFALECASGRYYADNRRFIRVSEDFLIYVDGLLRNKIRQHVETLPSVGRTIR